MSFKIRCSKCEQKIEVGDELDGTLGVCPACNANIVIRKPENSDNATMSLSAPANLSRDEEAESNASPQEPQKHSREITLKFTFLPDWIINMHKRILHFGRKILIPFYMMKSFFNRLTKKQKKNTAMISVIFGIVIICIFFIWAIMKQEHPTSTSIQRIPQYQCGDAKQSNSYGGTKQTALDESSLYISAETNVIKGVYVSPTERYQEFELNDKYIQLIVVKGIVMGIVYVAKGSETFPTKYMAHRLLDLLVIGGVRRKREKNLFGYIVYSMWDSSGRLLCKFFLGKNKKVFSIWVSGADAKYMAKAWVHMLEYQKQHSL